MTDTPYIDWLELGRRAVACRGWRWMPGMRQVRPCCDEAFRVCDEPASVDGHVHVGGSPYDWTLLPSDVVPDFRDPATLGCLLALVREAWDMPRIGPFFSDGRWRVHSPILNIGFPIRDRKNNTEAAALVAALEAAP